MKRIKGFNRFLTAVIFALAALLSSATAVEVGQPLPAWCSNGIQDGNETGVDCGGSCALTVRCVGNCTIASVVDYCDGKDNDGDCLVDEDCKTNAGKAVAAPQPIKSQPPANQQAEPSCHDGFKNQDELYDDCGGVCVTNDAELCDGIDNDRDCQVDEGGVCDAKVDDGAAATATGQENVQTTAQPQESVSAPTPALSSAPVPSNIPSPDSGIPAGAAEGMVVSIPTEAETRFAALAGDNETIAQIRKMAKDNKIYIPDNETDAELLKKYTAFTKKHEAEFSAKFEGKSPTESEVAGVLSQFSSEAYPKPAEPKPQTQSFFSKVKGFFKKLFGG